MTKLPMETISACAMAKKPRSKKREKYALLMVRSRRPCGSTSARKMIKSIKAPIHSVRLINSEDMPEP